MATDFERQSWQREMLNFKGVKSLFILEGNVNDKYPDVVDGGLQFSELAEVVRGLFEDANGSVEYTWHISIPSSCFRAAWATSIASAWCRWRTTRLPRATTA